MGRFLKKAPQKLSYVKVFAYIVRSTNAQYTHQSVGEGLAPPEKKQI